MKDEIEVLKEAQSLLEKANAIFGELLSRLDSESRNRVLDMEDSLNKDFYLKNLRYVYFQTPKVEEATTRALSSKQRVYLGSTKYLDYDINYIERSA